MQGGQASRWGGERHHQLLTQERRHPSTGDTTRTTTTTATTTTTLLIAHQEPQQQHHHPHHQDSTSPSVPCTAEGVSECDKRRRGEETASRKEEEGEACRSASVAHTDGRRGHGRTQTLLWERRYIPRRDRGRLQIQVVGYRYINKHLCYFYLLSFFFVVEGSGLAICT